MSRVVRARAPLRLGLAGGGTDVAPYCDLFGGAVLNAAISWYAYATVGPSPTGKLIFRAEDLDKEEVLDPDIDLPLRGDLALHRGVWRRLMRDYNDSKPLAVTVSTCADVPAGSGLGSSSTIVVAMIEAFKEYLRLPLGEYDVAQLAVQIERHDLALKGGLQDQYAATFGGVNFMEFNADNHVIINPLRVRDPVIAELEASLVLYFTGVSRESAAIIEDQSRLLDENRSASIDAMHALKEDAIQMKERLLRGAIPGVAKVLGRSWEAKKKTSGRVSNPLIERIHAVAMENGALAGKVSGAGGGGFMMFMAEPTLRPRLVRALEKEEGRVMTCHFTSAGAQAWRVNEH
jgi:D-glycero-alpha-D-manno-heptose-7-phosphate kinase